MKITYGENDSADIIVETGSSDGFLMGSRSASLFREDEASSNPDSAGTEHKSSCQSLSIEDTTSSNDLHGQTSHRTLVALDKLNYGWEKDSSWVIAGVTTTFTTLSADNVNTELQALLDVLWMANHVHVENAVLVKLINDSLWWDTNSRDEKFGARFNNNINELAKLALGVVVADRI